ncbi:endothelin-converting enzyme homolog [Centruroides sculpturatus]|uniref:endothelin-converting enzyme homolog n=1 Tax=Centruroides sculpturatus TaxID=218467 RepID=UPI000C6EAE55|nr:endothelin-converting enzyme homolog [Centruroides sculpturatus]
MEDVCITANCLKQVNYIRERMNDSVDPCKDFYQFACGHYGKIHVTNEIVKIHTVANDVEDEVYRLIRYHLENHKSIKGREFIKAREFYSKCSSKVESFKDIKELSDAILSNADKYDLEKLFAKITTLGSNPFFDVVIEKDKKKYLVIYSKPKPEDKLTQLKEEVYCDRSMTQYHNSRTSYQEMIRATKAIQGNEKTSVKDLAEKMIDFEARLATSLSEVSCDDDYKDSCDVDKKKQNLAHKIVNIYASNTRPEYVFVNDNCPSYSAEVFCKFLNDSVATDYVIWRHIMRFLPLISTPFRRSFMALIKDMNKGNNIFDYPRYFIEKWKQCIHITNHIFGMALGTLYRKTEYEEDGEKEIKALAQATVEIYHNVLRYQDWLDEDVAENIRVKLEELKIAIGGPDWLTDRHKVKDLYIKIKTDNPIVSTILQNEENITRKQSMNEPRIEENWFITTPPISSEIKYYPDDNVLVLPMGALRFPYFIPDYFKFAKYSSIGTLTAQAIYSIFSIQDILDSEFNGNVSDYFLDEYRERRNCYKYQYFNDTGLNEDNMKEDDIRNAVEAIIRDNIALKAALGLYQRDMDEELKLPNLDYNAQQLFFIQYAQTYCEVSNQTDWTKGKYVQAKYRVNNALSNNEIFSEVFSCSETSAMNRKDKCEMWK